MQTFNQQWDLFVKLIQVYKFLDHTVLVNGIIEAAVKAGDFEFIIVNKDQNKIEEDLKNLRKDYAPNTEKTLLYALKAFKNLVNKDLFELQGCKELLKSY